MIAYYVTGHGLGHATRSVYTIQSLLDRNHIVHIISSVSSSFFTDNLNSSNYTVHTRALDGGAIQKGPLCIDAYATLEKYYQNIYLNYNQLLRNEINFLLENNIKMVIVDATPLACIAGKEAGCKVIILSNFTWDQMYQGMLEEIRPNLSKQLIENYSDMITKCSEDYCHADLYLQLPGAVPLPPSFLATNHSYGPLLGRTARRSREEILQQYSINVPVDHHILLIGFGGHDLSSLSLPLDSTSLPSNWIYLLLGQDAALNLPPSSSSSPRVIPISYQCYVPDLISISSAVLGKLGYGFVSECLLQGTPLLYVTRSCWPEEVYLRDYMTTYQGKAESNGESVTRINCLEMKESDLLSGNWSKYLSECVKSDKETNDNDIKEKDQKDKLDEVYEMISSWL